jgi:small subunit ribosomal protein S19e
MLIKRVAQHLKENFPEIVPPGWMRFAKTGAHVEEPPKNPDFWYIRCASLLRKVYMEGPIGVDHLRKKYGGRFGRGNEGEHKRSGGGSAVRKPLMQLEKAGLVRKVDRQGRVVTKEGASLLDKIAGEVMRALERDMPEIKKYR